MIVCGCVRVARDMVSLRQKLVSLDRTGRETFAGAGWFWTVRVPMSKLGHSSVRRVIENKRSRRWRKYVFKSNVDSSQQSVVQVRCAPERIDYPKNISPAWTRRSRVGEPSPPSHRPCVLMLLKSYRRQPSFWPVTSIFVHRKRSRHVVLLSS